MPSYVTPKSNTAFICYVALTQQADTKLLKANPTLAAGDVKVSTDGGAFANITTLPTVTPAAGTAVKVSLSASEMNGDNIVVAFIDAAGAEWCDLLLSIQTSARQVDDLAYPTTSGRSLDVSATGEAGVDWANVGSPTTTVDLSGTTIKTTQKVDVDTIKTNPVANGGTVTFPTNATLASTTNITAGTIATATNVTTVNGLAAGVLTATAIAADAITAAKIADGAIDAATFAAGAINAAAIAADAITDAKVASDVTIASVTGAVGSVTGAVGSVTGNVGGNVTGSVGSVATGGIAAASFAAGAIDASAIAADAIGSSELAASAVNEIADQVWDELLAGHTTAGSAGKQLQDISTGTAPTVAAIADAVWEEAIADHSGTAGSTAESMAAAGGAGTPPTAAAIADAVWDEALAGHVGAGSAGAAEGNLDATISSRAAASTLATVAGYVDTEVAAIKAKTDNLPASPAATSDIPSANAIADQVWDELLSGHVIAGSAGKQLGDIALGSAPSAAAVADAVWDETLADHAVGGSTGATLSTINAAVDTEVAAILAAVDTEVAAIKAKTDLIPASPAAVGSAMTLTSGERDSIGAALLKLDLSAVTGEATRSVLNAVRWLRNRFVVSGTALTVFKEDDVTPAWTGTVSKVAGDAPIREVDPA